MGTASVTRLAAVTGASSGIGRELARIFAENGFDLVVAAEDDAIAEVARELAAQTRRQVEPIQVDLRTYEGVENLYAAIRGLGRPLDAIAINAGVGVGGDFTRETDLMAELGLIQLNVVSTVHLAKRVLPDMVARGVGRVLFTASIAGIMPTPLEAVYGASKAFVLELSASLRSELEGTGVTVTALMPGPTDTNFFERAGLQDKKVAEKALENSAADVARAGYDALMAGKERVVAGNLEVQLQGHGARFIPESAKAAMHNTRAGTTFGHEFTGTVAEVGPEVQTLKKGDRVVVPFNVACGTCYFCTRGLTASCANSNPCCSVVGGCFGYSHTTGGYDGGQAEQVRVPFADIGPMKIPDDMTEEDVLFLSDILPTGYQAAEMGEIKEGETVVVFGAGPVGLFAAKSAWLLGAGRVIVVDRLDYRLEWAGRFAGAETVNFEQVAKKDIVAHLRKMTDGRGADVCIDAVGCEAEGSRLHTTLGLGLMLEAGSPTAITWAIDAVRRAGNVVLIGVYGPPFNLVPIGTAMNKGLTLRMGQANVKRYMPQLLEHIRAGRIDAKSLITHRFDLEETPDAYRLFEARKDGVIKCVVIPPRARALAA